MKWVFVVVINALAVFGILKAYDYYLEANFRSTIPDEDADRPTMRTGELYPYTGTHMASSNEPLMRCKLIGIRQWISRDRNPSCVSRRMRER